MSNLQGLLASGALALFVTLLIAALALGGVISMAAVRVCLFLAWVVGIVGILASESFLAQPLEHKKLISAGLGIVLAAVLFGFDRWIESYGSKLPAPKQPESLPSPGEVYEQELSRFLDDRTVVFVEPHWVEKEQKWEFLIRHLGDKQPANNVTIEYWDVRKGLNSGGELIRGLNLNPDPGGVEFLRPLPLTVTGNDQRLAFQINDSKETIVQELWLQVKDDGRTRVASRATDSRTHEIILFCKDPEMIDLDESWNQFTGDVSGLMCLPLRIGHLLPERTKKIFGKS